MASKRILLHACCGPCSITTIDILREQGFEVTAFFYNPNIHPLQEYVRRRESFLEVAKTMDVKVIGSTTEYDSKKWFRDVAFREDNRCFHCYADRLERTLSLAKRGNFDFFTTTLLYSKFQKHKSIADLGKDLAASGKCEFLYYDFREGWKEGIERSKDMGIYRQQYCGCLFSENERFAKEL
ncbi:epoxyqueuosine reductase QueH [Maridesulfovibrio frigidus]|uniref:epoxyqueuosine reductase QueH n=1 Tax=Maridesulfovibrio frigidus TaxID=340956 RepID=UPI0004E0B79E|nr:epoxyqueuosine reductase QueH [Maridesulfovibrio frigidus]